jgi:2-polyprenyl-3-methyl-5-hydroxy-6-metoxy-1,4-benzoquinol methylase
MDDGYDSVKSQMTVPLDLPMRCPVCALEEGQPEVIERHSTQFQSQTWSYTIYRCALCYSQFAWPRKAAPPEWYAEQGEYYGWRWEFDLFLHDVKVLRSSGLQRESFRILEVGCGEGLLLESLSPYGDAWGLEWNHRAAEIGTAKGLRVETTNLSAFRDANPSMKFQIAGCFQVIEHLERPDEFLVQMREVLTPGGWLFLSIPNPDRYMLHLERERWDFPPHHLTRFSKYGIKKLLDRFGFQVKRMIDRPIGDSDKKAVLNKIYRKVPLPKRIRHILKLPILAACYPVALWMRGAAQGQDLYLAAERTR